VKDVLGDDWKKQQEANEIDVQCKKVSRMLNNHQTFYVEDLTKILHKLSVRDEKDKCIFRIETINKRY